MRLGRRRAPQGNAPMTLPQPADSVVLVTARGGRIPARVLESEASSLLLAIMVPTKPLTAAQLADMVLEYSSARGRVRLHGAFVCEEADVLRMHEPRSLEVMQERSYVRIRAARPVIVYGAGGTPARTESYTVDVSGGGCLLGGEGGDSALAIGDEVGFTLSLAAGEKPVTGTARVARVDAQGRRALSFVSISDFDRRRLVRFIFECQRTERRRGLTEESGGRR